MERERPPESKTGRGRVLLGIAAAVLAVLGLAYVLSSRTPSTDGGSSGEALSLAVLPFGVEGTRDIDHIADGITTGLIARLSRVDALRVTPSSSVARYEGIDREPVDLGRELGVSAVVSGWVRLRGEYLVMDVKLQDVEDGRVLWDHRYTRLWDDLVLMEQRSAQYVLEALGITLTKAQSEEVTRQPTENGVAYDLYLKARHRANSRSTEGVLEAIEHFDAATAVDSTFAKAYDGLAGVLLTAYELGHLGLDADACARARAAAEKAAELDASLAATQATLGSALWVCDYDWIEAERAYQRAMQLDPHDVHVMLGYANFLGAANRVDEALALDERVVSAEPYASAAHLSLAMHLTQAGRYEEADPHFERARGLAPHSPEIETAWLTSRIARGSITVDDDGFPPRPPGGPHPADLQKALIELLTGDADAGFARAGRMAEERNPALVHFFAHPFTASYRQDERFLELAREVAWPPATRP